jgi:hypothetical protein
MANFCNYPKMERITEINLPNSLDPNSDDVTIGLWGFKDSDGKELEILSPPYVSIKKGDIDATGMVRLYSLSSYHPGSWSIEARTVAGDTWDRLKVFVKSQTGSSPSGGKYTSNANEVVTRQTKPSAADVVSMLHTAWPELNEQGARTLTAQFMFETGEGNNCYNWNLGNVKAGANDKHMYLKGVWECATSAGAQGEIDRSNGLARLATAEEISRKGWKCDAPTSTVVVFEPPHPVSRFRAYDSLSDGAQRWVAHHQRIAQRYPDYVANLNAGNVAAVAHTLKQVQYYSGSEPSYVTGMTGKKAKIDRELGAP